MLPPISFEEVIARLEAMYGPPDETPVTDPYEIILWENVAYLADDEKRAAAFTALKEKIGTRPEEILAARHESLREITKAGILPEQRAEKLRSIAETALDEFGGDLSCIRCLPLAQARKALKQFPGIGDPGAEKILLFSRIYPILALESNGLRALVRIGLGRESPDYAATYRSAQEAAGDVSGLGFDRLMAAHQLLRRHGQVTCRRSGPRCEACALAPDCRFSAARISPQGE